MNPPPTKRNKVTETITEFLKVYSTVKRKSEQNDAHCFYFQILPFP